MAEQSPLTGCEPNSLIEISSEYTPINFLSRRNSFTTDLNDVPTAWASDVAEIHDERQLPSSLSTQEKEEIASPVSAPVHQQAAASGSQQQPASSSVVNPWQTLNVGSCGKLQRSGDSNVEKSLLKGKRDRKL